MRILINSTKNINKEQANREYLEVHIDGLIFSLRRNRSIPSIIEDIIVYEEEFNDGDLVEFDVEFKLRNTYNREISEQEVKSYVDYILDGQRSRGSQNLEFYQYDFKWENDYSCVTTIVIEFD